VYKLLLVRRICRSAGDVGYIITENEREQVVSWMAKGYDITGSVGLLTFRFAWGREWAWVEVDAEVPQSAEEPAREAGVAAGGGAGRRAGIDGAR
jgi:hypothetical protein